MAARYTEASHVPQLDRSGSNYWRWEAALKLYAQLNACNNLLNRV